MTTASDNFNRANGPLGANWTDWNGGVNAVTIASNAALGTLHDPDSGAFWNANTFGADQFSQAVLASVPALTRWAGVVVRASADGTHLYLFMYYEGSVYLFRKNTNMTGGYTSLTSTAYALNPGDTLRIEAEGTTIRGLVNGVQQLSTIDANYATGQPGIAIFDSDVGVLDTWAGGDLSATILSGRISSASAVRGGQLLAAGVILSGRIYGAGSYGYGTYGSGSYGSNVYGATLVAGNEWVETGTVQSAAAISGTEYQLSLGVGEQGRRSVFKSVGPPNTPQEIKRLRRENMDLCRRMGQPVVVRHMYEREDVDTGIAKTCPACYDAAYDQVRNDCTVCYGFGFVSTEDNPFQIWIDPSGQLQETATPGVDWVRAPRYGGFAIPYLTWIVEPDVAVDVFRINEQGVMVKTYDAQGVAPWFPDLGDNDLCVNVTLAKDGFTIIDTFDRFQLKMVQQITIRGFGRRQRYATDGNPFKVAQSFQMSHSPTNQQIYNVPVDEPWY